MPDTPLNPDALEVAGETLWERMSDPIERKVYGFTDAPTMMTYANHARAAVSAYLAVAQPVVASIEELDALPAFAHILAFGDTELVKLGPNTWHALSSNMAMADDSIRLPALVLHLPGVNDA